MIDFAQTTAFGFVRRLAAAGMDGPSTYLLVAENSIIESVQADLAAEVQVQLGTRIRLSVASELRPDRLAQLFATDLASPVMLVRLDSWTPRLIEAVDRNVVLVTMNGTVLFLGTHELAERMLGAAPNLRSRLADVLAITPDESMGDSAT
jgi:hypothetical protein